jgi:hypothetical protein
MFAVPASVDTRRKNLAVARVPAPLPPLKSVAHSLRSEGAATSKGTLLFLRGERELSRV